MEIESEKYTILKPKATPLFLKKINKGDVDSIRPKYQDGRPPTFNEEQRRVVVELAENHLKDLGCPLSQRSLSQV